MTTLKDLLPNCSPSIADVEVVDYTAETITLACDDRSAMLTAILTAMSKPGVDFVAGDGNTVTLCHTPRYGPHTTEANPLLSWNERMPAGVTRCRRPLPPVKTKHADGCLGADCTGIDAGSNRRCACQCH